MPHVAAPAGAAGSCKCLLSAVLSLRQAACKHASCTTALLDCPSLQQVLGDMPAELLPWLLLLYSAMMAAESCPHCMLSVQ